MNRLIEPLIERYKNDIKFHTFVDGCLCMYRNTGLFPVRMIKGDKVNDLFSGQDFADAVELAKHMTERNEE